MLRRQPTRSHFRNQIRQPTTSIFYNETKAGLPRKNGKKPFLEKKAVSQPRKQKTANTILFLENRTRSRNGKKQREPSVSRSTKQKTIIPRKPHTVVIWQKTVISTSALHVMFALVKLQHPKFSYLNNILYLSIINRTV